MSKVSRQEAKQNRAANKQNGAPTQKQSTNNGQVSKQDQPVELKTTNSTAKQAQAASKPATSQASKQNAPAGKPVTRQAIKYERRQEEKRKREEEHKRAARRKRIAIVSITAAVVVVLAAVLIYFVSGYANPGNAKSNASSAVVPSSANLAYPVIGGVPCDTTGHDNDYHIHVHVSIYINGQQVQIPAQVGIPTSGSCLYWLHTHDASNVIHIEAPAGRNFTLGTFFDIWGQQFSSLKYPPELDQPGGSGWQVWVNGKLYNGDFHNIPLQAHLLITLANNTSGVQPDTVYNWGNL
jgi:hypothetical protein